MSFRVTPIGDCNMHSVRWMMNEECSTRNEKGGEPGLLASPFFPLRGIPISLTEGGLSVVCWPALFNQKNGKFVAGEYNKKSRSLRNVYNFRLA